MHKNSFAKGCNKRFRRRFAAKAGIGTWPTDLGTRSGCDCNLAFQRFSKSVSSRVYDFHSNKNR